MKSAAVVKRRRKRISLFSITNYSLFVLLGIIMLYPLWYVFIASIVTYKELISSTIILIPKNPGFHAYIHVFNNKTMMPAFVLTVWTTVAGTALAMFFTIMAGFVFSVKSFPFRNFCFTLILITMLFGGGLIPYYILLKDLRLINNPLVYIIPGCLNTFYMIILRTAFNEIPDSIKEAAEIDGCSMWRIMITIVIPLSMPAIATIMLFFMVDKWNDLYTCLYFIYRSHLYNLQRVLYNMLQGSNSGSSIGSISLPTGQVMIDEQVKYACILVATIPILCVYPFLQKYFTKGVMLGAIKG